MESDKWIHFEPNGIKFGKNAQFFAIFQTVFLKYLSFFVLIPKK